MLMEKRQSVAGSMDHEFDFYYCFWPIFKPGLKGIQCWFLKPIAGSEY
jgi:hypothetical protein